MKITGISIYQARLPLPGVVYKLARETISVSEIDSTIVEIHSDRGVVGWGEIAPWGRTYLPEFAEGARAAIAVIAPHLVGQDPRDLYGIDRLMKEVLFGHGYAKSAVDMACWDILGKTTGLPVCLLLGGQAVDRVPLVSSVYQGPIDDMMARIARRREQGYRYFTSKVSDDPAVDAEMLERVSESRQPDETHIVDANCAWSVPTALMAAKKIEELGFVLEQPCNSYEECLRVRRHIKAPMMLDELIVDFDTLIRVIKDNACDIVQLKISRIGGLTNARMIRDVCTAAGIGILWAPSGGSSLADAAAAHIALSTPPANLFALWRCGEFVDQEVAQGGPVFAEGHAFLGNEPGLGVTLDKTRLGQPIAEFG